MSTDAHKLKAQVIEARKNVRKKFHQLRMEDVDMSEGVEKLMRPIITPLQKISKNTTNPQLPPPPPPTSAAPSISSSSQFASPMGSPVQGSEDESDVGGDVDFKFNYDTPLRSQLLLLHAGAGEGLIDQTYGPKMIMPGRHYRLGGIEFRINNESDLIFDGRKFKATPGLYELLFLREPKDFTRIDFRQYSRLLERSNVARVGASPSGRIISNRSYKYINIIKPSLTHTPPLVQGSGMGYLQYTGRPVEYKFWNDPNELIARLALLHASLKAGNESCRNEIVAIEEELREARIIY